ncbi:MAG TPA: hypothetical protein VHV10_09645 [Ktedonobacteraceae bacterium]|nr:hypothetical protein [Ktedonobacteraceae bacterium]
MPKHSHHTTREQDPQATHSEDDWSKQVLPQLPANLQEQAMKFKAFERSRKISSASDLLRGLLAYVYTAHSFQHLSMWSVLLGVADVSANDWRKRLQKASAWLDWLLGKVRKNVTISRSVTATEVSSDGTRAILGSFQLSH